MATKKVVTVKPKKKASSGTSKSTAKAKPIPSKGGKKSTKSKSNRKSSGGGLQDIMRGELIYGREAYMWMIGGVVLVALGFLLMLGGAMPSPDVWEPERIYSFRRITLAPIVILLGLGMEFYAIFRVKA